MFDKLLLTADVFSGMNPFSSYIFIMMLLIPFVLVPAGILGSLGAILRFNLSKLNGKFKKLEFLPIGTILTNIFGCSLILLFHISHFGNILPDYNILSIGFCGGLSTLSTAMVECLEIKKTVGIKKALFYLTLTILIPITVSLVAVMFTS